MSKSEFFASRSRTGHDFFEQGSSNEAARCEARELVAEVMREVREEREKERAQSGEEKANWSDA